MKSIILPGMGADSGMYAHEAYEKLCGLFFADWPAYNDERSISEIAHRVIDENNINENCMVGGSSLGGIIAAEISKLVKVKKLVLIGSTLSPLNINPVLRNMSGLAEVLPVHLVQILTGKISLTYENSVIEMFSRAESDFIKAMCRAVFEWSGNVEPECEVCHIHGAKDTVILPPADGATILEDAGHLLAVTHSVKVAEFIGNAMA